MKRITMLLVSITIIATMSCKKECQILQDENPPSKTLADRYWPDNTPSDSCSFAAHLAVFSDKPVESVVITDYLVFYAAPTPDNSLATVSLADSCFIEINRTSVKTPEYGAFTTVNLASKAKIRLTPATYLVDPTKIWGIRISFKYRVNGIWYRSSLDTHIMGQIPDPFWV